MPCGSWQSLHLTVLDVVHGESRLLETAHGNVTQAARLAQRNRTEFYKLLAKHELDPARFKAG